MSSILQKAEDGLAQANKITLKSGTSTANQNALAALKADLREIEVLAKPAPAPTPPAPSPEPAPPAGGELLFAGRKLSDFELIQASPATDVSEVSDPAGLPRKVFRLAVGNEDNLAISGNPRAEIITPWQPPMFADGSDFWAMFEVYFPANFPALPKGAWMICAEGPYGEPFAGSPPWSLTIFPGQRIGWQRNESHDWDIPWEAPLVRGAWQKILVHQRFASSGGFVECWLNGTPITFFSEETWNPSKITAATKLPTQTIDATISKGPWSIHLDLYRQHNAIKQVVELFHGPFLIGTTRAAVGG